MAVPNPEEWGAVAVVSCSAAAFAIYSYLECYWERTELLRTMILSPSEVEQKLKASNKKELDYVAIHGDIQCEKPVQTTQTSEVQDCVRVDTEIFEQRAKWEATREWVFETIPLTKDVRGSSFTLHDRNKKNGGFVLVRDIRSAEGDLKQVSNKYEALSSFSLQSIHGFFNGSYTQGHVKKEIAIPTALPITLVGKLVLGADGTVEIVPPDLKPFLVTFNTVLDLVPSADWKEIWLQRISIILSVGAIAAIVKWLLQRRQYQREMEARQAYLDRVRRNPPSNNTEGGEAHGNHCVICLDADRDSVFLDCAHQVCCQQCAANVINCPICRAPIRRVVRVYRP
eukprot:m.103016 g.103016  ORF g.103016 m.103016 type:complete len:341 (-) comp13793_c0_seq2:766-1788(-)